MITKLQEISKNWRIIIPLIIGVFFLFLPALLSSGQYGAIRAGEQTSVGTVTSVEPWWVGRKYKLATVDFKVNETDHVVKVQNIRQGAWGTPEYQVGSHVIISYDPDNITSSAHQLVDYSNSEAIYWSPFFGWGGITVFCFWVLSLIPVTRDLMLRISDKVFDLMAPLRSHKR